LNKQAKKLIKLQTKAQECTSRTKAVKILHKADKTHKKITKMSEAYSRHRKGAKPPKGSGSPES
tara:strand:+ start:261 stop:452 length:192 start_codon:yes stop_codon:yes gene_type:complete